MDRYGGNHSAMNSTALYAVAVVAVMLASVTLSVMVCEWRVRRRAAKESAAMRLKIDAYLRAEREKADRYIQSLSPEKRTTWERWQAMVSPDLCASEPRTEPSLHDRSTARPDQRTLPPQA